MRRSAIPAALSGTAVYRLKFLIVSAEFSSPSTVRIRVSMTTSCAPTLTASLRSRCPPAALSRGGQGDSW